MEEMWILLTDQGSTHLNCGGAIKYIKQGNERYLLCMECKKKSNSLILRAWETTLLN